MSKVILIVDDELDIQSSLSHALRDESYSVLVASSPKEALEILSKNYVDLALLDVWFPDGDGMQLLKECVLDYPKMVPVMMSGHGTIELALNSIRDGAFDFLEKPLELEKVLVVLSNALENQSLKNKNTYLTQELFKKSQLIGSSPMISDLKVKIQKASLSKTPALIHGALGTGKERAARLLHKLSKRSQESFFSINCKSMNTLELEEELWGDESPLANGRPFKRDGKFELVEGGTLYLSDVDALSLQTQAKFVSLLENNSYTRIASIQELPFQAKLIFGTTQNLEKLVRDGKFREELYLHFKNIEIHVPSLQERKEDLNELLNSFSEAISHDYLKETFQFQESFLDWAQSYEWPGNLRELKNIVERIIMMKDDQSEITLADLPEEIQNYQAIRKTDVSLDEIRDPQGSLRELRGQFEKSILKQRLEKMGGNVTRTAESLGIERAHLHRKLKHYELEVKRGAHATTVGDIEVKNRV